MERHDRIGNLIRYQWQPNRGSIGGDCFPKLHRSFHTPGGVLLSAAILRSSLCPSDSLAPRLGSFGTASMSYGKSAISSETPSRYTAVRSSIWKTNDLGALPAVRKCPMKMVHPAGALTQGRMITDHLRREVTCRENRMARFSWAAMQQGRGTPSFAGAAMKRSIETMSPVKGTER